MANTLAKDTAGNPIESGNTGTLNAIVLGKGGGMGTIRIRLLFGATSKNIDTNVELTLDGEYFTKS